MQMLFQFVALLYVIVVSISIMFFKGRPFLPVQTIGNSTAALISQPSMWVYIVCAIALIAALFLVFRRDTYLPFLGTGAFPTGILAKDNALVTSRPDAHRFSVPIDAEDGTLVIYWAATASKTVAQSPQVAYARNDNQGVAYVDNGYATFLLACPGEYYVNGGLRPRHVHYRVHLGDGLFGPVLTQAIQCQD